MPSAEPTILLLFVSSYFWFLVCSHFFLKTLQTMQIITSFFSYIGRMLSVIHLKIKQVILPNSCYVAGDCESLHVIILGFCIIILVWWRISLTLRYCSWLEGYFGKSACGWNWRQPSQQSIWRVKWWMRSRRYTGSGWQVGLLLVTFSWWVYPNFGHCRFIDVEQVDW